MKRLGILTAALAICAIGFVQRPLQAQVPPPGSELVPLRTTDQLDQLLGPIALYPDPLIAQILPAATTPSEIVLADRYVRNGGDVNQIDVQPWGSSVKAVAHYPEVLKWMDDNLAWTTDLGQVFINQPDDVMNAIQRLRAKAQSIGALQTTPQQQIINDSGLIEIVPANPELIYVPVYQPEIVYGWRPYPRTGLFLSFGAGFAVGSWLNHDFDWHDHHVIAWRREDPRPRDWWYRPAADRRQTIVRNNVVVFNGGGGEHSANVWHPRSRPPISEPQREDRGREIRPVEPRREVASRPVIQREEPRHEPIPETRRPQEPVRRVEPTRPAESRSVPESRPLPTARPAPTPQPQVARPQPQSRPVERPTTGALIGIHSAQDTRGYSTRGQQSRETVSRPAPQQAAPRPTPQAAPRPAPQSVPGQQQRERDQLKR